MSKSASALDSLYEFLNDEEDARVCKDIDEAACREVPRNFFLTIATLVLTKVADELVNPKTLLTWLMSLLQAPAFLIGLLVPLRESGSLVPQLVIAHWVRQQAVRKWFWVLGSLCQGLAVLGIALVPALGWRGMTAGLAIVLLLALFSLARGLCSVASKDVLGKTIPKTRRGRLSGYATSAAGVFGIVIGLWLLLFGQQLGLPTLTGLLGAAAMLWFVAAALFTNIDELPGATEGGGQAIAEAFSRLSVLRDDRQFRNFVIVRTLLLCTALTTPFVVLLAQRNLDNGVTMLGALMLANALASTLSATIWGKAADISSRKVMIAGAAGGAGTGIVLVSLLGLVPTAASWFWLYPAVMFAGGVAHAGARLGRKTYVTDMAGGNKRTDYVAVSNTLIGLALLVTGVFTGLASLISAELVILLLAGMGIAGALLAARQLPEVQ